jgi:hypothetical protein
MWMKGWICIDHNSYLVETATARWLRFPIWFQKGTCLVDLPNDLALNIHAAKGKFEVYTKNADGVYRLLESATVEINAVPKLEIPFNWAQRLPIKQRLATAKGI